MSVVRNKSALPWPTGWYAFVKETGTTIGPGHTWHYIKQLVGAHLDKNGLNVGDREQYLHDAVCMAMERDGRGGQCIKAFKLSQAQQKTREYDLDPRIPRGMKGGKSGYDARSWGIWHLAAWDGKLTPGYARELIARIGCGSCRSHAQRYVTKKPIPPGMKGDDGFRWSYDFHRSVSLSIKKSVPSYEDAKRFWGLGE